MTPTLPKSVADRVFDTLQQQILSLELPPNTRISEAEVAARLGASRQPVREAFRRLANLGFLNIRPQSGTTVTLISEEAVLKSRFIRIALETQTCRAACRDIADDGLAILASLISQQRQAITDGDRQKFHILDDQFHRQICVSADVGFAWDIISDHKAHMDRVRMLSLDTSSQNRALDEHIAILAAITARDPNGAAHAMTAHLTRIETLIAQLKQQSHNWFTDDSN
ncbi:transcriptional regulator, GntR family [Loktanella salsilacus]|uniref:Transcriptional regulator, GntR family n=1 Tax=Loktanella salsilacus TaxID=195913 RepID=A0A1I4DL41_9RHOB|nr:GntR family transcriptional regulator [Loktanella salsilacus]SFK93639.1 transcriptional regulator, GntR family [Loktanella salsilacus]